jgi:hypothetical protein
MMFPVPNWSRLPFTTTSQEWMGFTHVPTAADVMALLECPDSPSRPMIYFHKAVIAAFAQAAGIEEGAAALELSRGVNEWWLAEPARLRDGECMANVRFRGAPDLQLSLGYLDGCLLVHFPLTMAAT